MSLTVAIAIADEQTIFRQHFGAAPEYAVYRIEESGAQLIKTIGNPRAGDHHHHHGGEHEHGEHEHGHGHQGKQQAIAELLQAEDVKVIVSGAFGGGVRVMQQWFVPVLMKSDSSVAGALTKLGSESATLLEAYNSPAKDLQQL